MQQQQRWFSWLWQRKQPAAIVRIGPTVRSGRNGCLICRNFSGYFNELLVDVGLFHKLTSFQCCCAKFSSDHLCSNVSGIFFLFLKTSPCVHFFSTCTDLAVLWAYPKPSLKLFFWYKMWSYWTLFSCTAVTILMMNFAGCSLADFGFDCSEFTT